MSRSRRLEAKVAPPESAIKPFIDVRQKLAANESLVFSFQFYDKTNPDFACDHVPAKWFADLFDRLKELSRLDVDACRNTGTLRFHPINWQDVDHRFDLPQALYEQVADDCYQFALSRRTGRVHGFVVGNKFYVCLLDPYHHMYPKKK